MTGSPKMIGPVQLVVIELQSDKLTGQIARELHHASGKGTIRVLDALAIQKAKNGSIVTLSGSDLTPNQRVAYGAIVGGLMGLGATGTEQGAEAGAELGAEAFADRTFGLTAADIQAIAQEVPSGRTAVMVLFEHRWAIPLKEAIERANGVVFAQGMVRPQDLIALGADLADATATADQLEAASAQEGQTH